MSSEKALESAGLGTGEVSTMVRSPADSDSRCAQVKKQLNFRENVKFINLHAGYLTKKVAIIPN
tara:strand:- start:127 stop:318 length:192 start_codon:yes stop_codon:yes gene_type:complete